MCVDNDKNSYIIGNTYSADLPVTAGLINDSHSGDYDAFISKFDSCGMLVWCTYFGTPAFDSGEKITLSNDGSIVFCGYTTGVSTPTTTGCFQAVNNGGYDCYISKITSAGTLIWSTYFGQAGGDFAFDIKTDALDNIIIGGTTTSTNLYTTANSFQQNHHGNTDAFIARFNKHGMMKWCTYYGGSGSEDIHAITIDDQFNIIGAGGSFSTNLSTSAGAFQSSNNGTMDAYLIKLDSNCVRVFSTYMGGSTADDAWGLATDATGAIYLAGHTQSIDFDTIAGCYQSTNKGYNDWYLSKWSAGGALLNSTLFGGAQPDILARMLITSSNELMLIGKTESTDIPLLGTNNQSLLAGSNDVFMALFNTNLTPVWSSYYGGAAADDGLDLALYNYRQVVFAGTTNSTNYPLSPNPYQSTLQTSNDGLLTRLTIGNQLTSSLPENFVFPVSLYPNPFNGFIYVDVKEPYSVQWLSVLGDDISSLVKKTGPSAYDTSELPAGICFVKIKTATGIRCIKLCKTN